MSNKLRQTIAAVKDQTSIGLARVSSSCGSTVEVAVLKATTHEQLPTDPKHVTQILQLASSREYTSACVNALNKRLCRTRNWVVALKSLTLIFSIFQHGDSQFPNQLMKSTTSGTNVLNLSSFRDESQSNPWDYTGFVRTFALYLEEWLHCSLNGKLRRRLNDGDSYRDGPHESQESICEMRPDVLNDRISYWQRLLDKAIATRPTGSAKHNQLIQISLHLVVKESFDLYKDITDGLGFLLDCFPSLNRQTCLEVFHTSYRAAKQFDELAEFYSICKCIGVGRVAEYPNVQRISEELLETLKEFLHDDQSSILRRLNCNQAQQPVKKEEEQEEENPNTKNPQTLITDSGPSEPTENTETEEETDSSLDLVLIENSSEMKGFSKEWEQVLVESVNDLHKPNYSMGGGFNEMILNSLYDHSLSVYYLQNGYANSNPFLHGDFHGELLPSPPSTFYLNWHNQPMLKQSEKYSFGSSPAEYPANQEQLVQDLRRWMPNQNKILESNHE